MDTLKVKKVKGKITVLQAIPYQGVMVYLRKIGGSIFEYLIPYQGQIYSSYLIIKPAKGKTKLAKWEINQAAALIFTSAVATINFLQGKKISPKMKAVVNVMEKSRSKVENLVN